MSKTISQLMKAYDKNHDSLTDEEIKALVHYVKYEARLQMDSCDYGYLLGWFTLGDWDICLSPKEAGLDY